jgi:hypothetical protein
MGVAVDLTGQIFGRLRAESALTGDDGIRRWRCVCECGNTVNVKTGALRYGNNVSCGCKKASVEIACAGCGATAKHKQSRVGLYCSHKCYWNAKKGGTPWNKGVLGIPSPKKGKRYGPMSAEARKSMEAVWENARGKKRPGQCLSGADHPGWKGGVTTQNKRDRRKFAKEIKAIFERDDYTCQLCSRRGCCLHVDHVKGWAEYPALRFDHSNCRSLCRECHFQVTFGYPMPENSKWGLTSLPGKEG